jgi:hypothetical protein
MCFFATCSVLECFSIHLGCLLTACCICRLFHTDLSGSFNRMTVAEVPPFFFSLLYKLA